MTNAVGTCWYAADNQANISTTPYDGPANAGVYYAHAPVVPGTTDNTQTAACDSSAVPSGVTWGSSFTG